MENKTLNKFLKSKNAQQLSRRLQTVTVVIISVIVLFQIFASLVPEAQSAGDEFSDASKCGDVGCFFNTTSAISCLENSSVEGQGVTCPVAVETIPLAGLFGGTGVIILLLMVALFLGVLALIVPRGR